MGGGGKRSDNGGIGMRFGNWRFDRNDRCFDSCLALSHGLDRGWRCVSSSADVLSCVRYNP